MQNPTYMEDHSGSEESDQEGCCSSDGGSTSSCSPSFSESEKAKASWFLQGNLPKFGIFLIAQDPS